MACFKSTHIAPEASPPPDGMTFIAFNTAALNGLIPSSSNLTTRSPTFWFIESTKFVNVTPPTGT